MLNPLTLVVMPGNRVRLERDKAGLTQGQLAERLRAFGINMDQTAVSKIEHGLRKLGAEEAWALSQVLGIPQESLLPRGGNPQDARGKFSAMTQIKVASPVKPHIGDRSNHKMPVRRVEHLPGGGHALMDLSRPAGWTSRPESLEGVDDAYGLHVFDDAMAPVYRRGETLWINPSKTPADGARILLLMADGSAMIRELVAIEDEAYRVKRYKPTEDEERILKVDVRDIHVVCGNDEGR